MADRTRPQLGEWQQSDSWPWETYCDQDERPHVVPGFGPKHELSIDCWCHPVVEKLDELAAIMHNVAH